MTSETNYIVIDNSTLIGAALFPDSTPSRAMRLAFELFDVATSDEMLDELITSLRKPKHEARYEPVSLRERFFLAYRENSVHFSVTERIGNCRDVNDNMVLDLAYAAKVPLIIASDHDLTDLKSWREIEILTPRQFLDQFE